MSKPDHHALLSELSAREPIFHRREFGTTRAALEAMTDPDFWEIGASGRIYRRADVIEMLLERYKQPEPHAWPCQDFALRPLGEDLYQLTYTLTEPDRTTRRSTLWRQDGAQWVIMFHQGTVVT